jgi:hypothetical protein
MLTPLVEEVLVIMSVDFDATRQQLIIYSAVFKYLKKTGIE